MHLHHICIVDGLDRPASLPQLVADNIASLRAAHPGAEHKLWSGNALRELIGARFEPAVSAAFDQLRPYSYKCDLGRLCLLHLFGGIYADLGMRFVAPLQPPPGMGFAAFRSLPFLTSSWTTMSNGIIWSQAGRRECRIAIDMIVESCRGRVYGSNPLVPTGPVLFGRAIAAAMVERGFAEEPDQWIGQVAPCDPPTGELCHVTPDRRTVAVNTKRGRTLVELGLAGANGYADAWSRREVYG